MSALGGKRTPTENCLVPAQTLGSHAKHFAMTLVLAFQGQESIWLCADRRLTFPDRYSEGACKILSVEGTDGRALLGYAGLGSSLAGTQPSDWMNDLLANRPIGPLEGYLGLIADAMRADMPAHLANLAGAQAHQLLAPSIVNGETRLYVVTLELGRGGLPPRFIYTRYARTAEGGPPPRLAIAGSGYPHVHSPAKVSRELSKVVRAVEAGRVNPRAVADRLARVNHFVSEREPTVGKECMVVWCHNGGGFQFYDGSTKVAADLTIPTVVNGMDLRHILEASMPFTLKNFGEMRTGRTPGNYGKDIQAALDKLAAKPERKL